MAKEPVDASVDDHSAEVCSAMDESNDDERGYGFETNFEPVVLDSIDELARSPTRSSSHGAVGANDKEAAR